jgi:hypothetical protein
MIIGLSSRGGWPPVHPKLAPFDGVSAIPLSGSVGIPVCSGFLRMSSKSHIREKLVIPKEHITYFFKMQIFDIF